MARLGAILGGVIAATSLTVVGLVAAQPTTELPGELKGTLEPKPEAPPEPLKNGQAVDAPATPEQQAEAAPVKQPEPNPAPDRRPRYPIAILQTLDKVTAQSIRFEAAVGRPVRYRNLVFTVRSCETTTSEEQATDAIAFVEIEAQNPSAPLQRQVYKGWMFAASPSVHPLEHPVYDAWLIACKA